MNSDALEKVALWLEAGAPEAANRGMRFDMGPILEFVPGTDPKNWCGTACCIAGAAIALAAPDIITNQNGRSLNYWDEAVALIGIGDDRAAYLFAPFNSQGFPWFQGIDRNFWPAQSTEITPAWAARTIRHLMETGEVRWDLTK